MSITEKKPVNGIAETIARLMTEVEYFSQQIEKNNEMIEELTPLATWEPWPDQDVLPETLNSQNLES